MKQPPIFIQQTTTPFVPNINIGKNSRPQKALFSTRSLGGANEIEASIQEQIADNRADLNDLLLFNKSMANAPALGLDYENQEAKYKALLNEINTLAGAAATKENLNRVILISNELDLDIAMLNALFPQVVYRGVYMRQVSENIINNIGYEDNREDAQVAYASLVSIEPHLHLDKLTDANGNTSIPAAMRTIALLNEMAKFQNKIEKSYEEDKALQYSTKKRVLAGLAITLVVMIAIIVAISALGQGWQAIKGIMVLGIPMGVLIWSFIGSFAAVLEQFYKKPVYEFGSTLKWIIIRPVMGVVMAAGIYLAFTNGFNINAAEREGGFMLFIAFLIGLSDAFTFGIIDKLKTTAIDSVQASAPKQQVSQQLPVTTIVQPVAPTPEPIMNDIEVPPSFDEFDEGK